MPAPRRPLVVLLAALLVACSTPSPSPSAGTDASLAPSDSAPPSASPPPSATASQSPSPRPIAEDPPPLALEEVASGLEAPVDITATPDGLLLVSERVGRVVAIDPDRGPIGVSLDITDRVLSEGSEQGLLGLALHPDWADGPAGSSAYAHYSDRNGDTVLSEFQVSDAPGAPPLDATSERVMLQVDQPYANHNGGQLAFGPDGFLYMGLGDGGSQRDPHGNGQNRDALLGKILRIDVEGEPYAIPPTNPFPDGGGGAPEVYLYGLRNPWRFSFDRETGLLWIGDVGQNMYEEIDRVDPAADAGANLGWSVMEGAHCLTDPDCSTSGLTLPVAEYSHDFGCSVTGGHVYRGEAIPDLRGWYLFSDYCSGLLFGIASDTDGAIAPPVLLETGIRISTFGEGADGELYVADLDGGRIYRIVAGD